MLITPNPRVGTPDPQKSFSVPQFGPNSSVEPLFLKLTICPPITYILKTRELPLYKSSFDYSGCAISFACSGKIHPPGPPKPLFSKPHFPFPLELG
jgi:hypothetical protein